MIAALVHADDVQELYIGKTIYVPDIARGIVEVAVNGAYPAHAHLPQVRDWRYLRGVIMSSGLLAMEQSGFTEISVMDPFTLSREEALTELEAKIESIDAADMRRIRQLTEDIDFRAQLLAKAKADATVVDPAPENAGA